MPSPESLIIQEMSVAKKPENVGAGKPEKTQAELRKALEKRFGTFIKEVEASLDSYDEMLETGEFDDKGDEELGAGEKRKALVQSKIENMMNRAEKMKATIDSKAELPQSTPVINVVFTYNHPNTGKIETQEIIRLNVEQKIAEFLDLYKKTGLELPPDFEELVAEIWNRNSAEIQEAIEQNGFDDILLVPGNIPLSELADKMKTGNGYYTGSNFDAGGGFTGAVSQNVDKPRIILVHKKETLKEITEKTGLDTHLNITGGDAEKLYKADPTGYISTLEDFLVLERKYFEDTGKHLSDWNKKSAHWLPGTKSGARLVYAGWFPSVGELSVDANDLDSLYEDLGVRPSRSFF